MSHYEAPIREPLIIGHKTYHDITEDIARDIEEKDDKEYNVPIIKLIEHKQLEVLKKCASSWFLDHKANTLWLDFFVNDATKDAFKEHFNNGFECFQLFRLLYELNNYVIEDEIKTDVYRSKGVYTDGKLPTPSPSNDVFHFLDFYITKELKKTFFIS